MRTDDRAPVVSVSTCRLVNALTTIRGARTSATTRPTALGWGVYEYTYQDVTKRQPTVVRELREALKC